MNYRELQNALKALKAEGLTGVKLNDTREVLQAEYNRLFEAGLISTRHDDVETSGTAHHSFRSTLASEKCKETVELDPEIEALVAGGPTDDPAYVIATAAAYSFAGVAMVVLWVALIATTLAIAGLKCWHWCRNQYSDLALQLKHFDPSFEFPALAKPQLTSFIRLRTLLVH